ncbi:unnamed protein product [Cercopithifilaria johnstoni]|uniref:Uncharacterized protein n=1 Tax=Cercopithifilaria johnstoni TaxID=2874296 RepID=A0A8J2M3N2_9BILA|nr:unnamed protein product [Cercopithifilaria johnstoni]
MAELDEEANSIKSKVKGSKVFGNMIGAGISDDEDDDDNNDDDEEKDDEENDIFYADEDAADDGDNIPYRNKSEKSASERSNENDKKLDISSEDDF